MTSRDINNLQQLVSSWTRAEIQRQPRPSSANTPGQVIRVVNQATETIPPFAAMVAYRKSNAALHKDWLTWEVYKADFPIPNLTNGLPSNHILFNGPDEIRYNQSGYAQISPGNAFKVINSLSSTANAFHWCGPQDNNWGFGELGGGYQMLGYDDASDTEFMWVTPTANEPIRGRANGLIPHHDVGTVDAYKRTTGVITIAGVYHDWMTGDTDISDNKEVLIQWFAYESKWRVVGAECE